MIKVQPTKQDAYEQALAFRQRGFTYSEIAKICGVSRGTISNWLKNQDFSKAVAVDNAKKAVRENKKRLLLINKARLTERKRQHTEVLKAANIEYKHYRVQPGFIAGLALYLSLGDHHPNRPIRLSSARYELHQLFLRFAIDFLAVEKPHVRFWLLLHPDHNDVACMKHWSKKLALSLAQFHKNQVVPRRSQPKRLHFGTGNMIIGNALLKKKLTSWLRLLQKDGQN